MLPDFGPCYGQKWFAINDDADDDDDDDDDDLEANQVVACYFSMLVQLNCYDVRRENVNYVFISAHFYLSKW
jgi:hypothetical protein